MQDADIMGIAEHKLSEGKMAEWKGRFREGLWKLTGSGAEMSGETQQAGVALATKTFIKHIETPIKNEEKKQESFRARRGLQSDHRPRLGQQLLHL